jgi:hypothetical protein
MTDYSDAVDSYITAAKARTVTGMETSPEEAARITSLSDSSGVAPEVIAGDPDGFEKEYKGSLATRLVSSDAELMAYIHSHPMAAAVSQDDWGNLANISSAANTSAQMIKALHTPWDTLGVGWSAAKEDFNRPITQYTPDQVGELFPALDKHRALMSNFAATVGLNLGEVATEGVSNLLMGAIHGAGAMVAEEAAPLGALPQDVVSALGKVGIDASGWVGRIGTAEQLGRDVSGELERRITEPGLVKGGEFGKEFGAALRLWGEAGREVPKGIHPLIDAVKAGVNAELVKEIDRITSLAQDAKTKELSDRLFKDFVQFKYGRSNVSIPAEDAIGLYGDKLPEPGDGLLGWVKGIGKKLDLARKAGADVEIPIADWIAKIDPGLAKQLDDFVSIWPGGVSAEEAKQLAGAVPKAMVDDPLAQVRGAFGLEPMFSMGDRKLSLAQTDVGPSMHGLDILDENGRPVGGMVITPQGKNIEIENINGIAGMWANDFGPALIRDLVRQLKQMYPEAETISGYRVSGAREGRPEMVTIRLDTPNDWNVVEPMQDIFHGLAYRQMSEHWSARPFPTELMTKNQAALDKIAREEIAKITGGKAKVVTTSGLMVGGRRAQGLYQGLHEGSGWIVHDLLSGNPLGTGRHEGLHWLRQEGLIKDNEWTTLVDAARDEGWHERYHIDTRYPNASPAMRDEEAIAEGFRHYLQARDAGEAVREYSPVGQIFAKLAEFFKAIKDRITALLGHEPTWEELFQQAGEGAIGRREGVPLHQREMMAQVEPRAMAEDQLNNLKASGLRLDAETYANLSKLAHERYARDLAAAMKKAEKDETIRQGKEWRDNRKEMKVRVEEQVQHRPTTAADLFLGAGQLYGEDTGKTRHSLSSADLTPEQIAALPPRYVSKSGFPADDVARLFGFNGKDALVEALVGYQTTKGGLTAREHFAALVNAETDRRMEAVHGDLPENVLSEAKDRALSEAETNYLTEEYLGAAWRHGVTAVDKEVIKAEAVKDAGELPIGSMSSDKWGSVIRRAQELVIRSLANGDPATAVQALQRRARAGYIAAEVKEYEKRIKQMNALTETVGKMGSGEKLRDLPIDVEYLNYMHQIMIAVGYPVRRSVQAIAADIADRGTGTLADFTDAKQRFGRVMPVAEELINATAGNWKEMTGAQFAALHDSLKTLNHNGREERKIVSAGEKADLDDKIGELTQSLERFGEVKYAAGEGRAGWLEKGLRLPRVFSVMGLKAEFVLNWWDHFDQWGPWQQWGLRDLIDGNLQERTWNREFAKRFEDLKGDIDMSKPVSNPLFRVPFKGGGFGQLLDFNVENLIRIMLDMGSRDGPKSNLFKRANGYALKPEQVEGWVHEVAEKEHWDYVQRIWDDIFAEIKQRGDRSYRSLSGGVAPDSIKFQPIQTKFGTYRGGYFPTSDFHPTFHDGVNKDLAGKGDSLLGSNFISGLPTNSWARDRTGYVAPLALDLKSVPFLIRQQLHDIAMRPALINASKIFFDKRITSAISLHVGTEYADMLKSYVRDVANNRDYLTANQAYANSWAESLRRNLVTVLTGANLGTFAKHTPTALMTSIVQVGPEYFLRAVRALFEVNEETGQRNYKWIKEKSELLRARDRNWQETLYGQIASQTGESTLHMRAERLYSKPVALGDLLSSNPTFLGGYMRAIDEGRTQADAIYAGERAVRRAHGDVAITNMSQFQRSFNPWFTSIYNFWSTMFNRTMEVLWMAGEAAGHAKAGDRDAAMGMVPKIAAGLFAAAIWPAIIEQLVSPIKSEPGDSWGKKAAKAMAYTESSTLPLVRDVAHSLIEGGDVTLGLSQTGVKELQKVYEDVWKKQPMSPAHAQRLIKDFAGLAGLLLKGLVPQELGNVAAYAYGVKHGLEHPKGPWGWLVGARYGTGLHHSSTVINRIRGRAY